jgi:hypothetical protein
VVEEVGDWLRVSYADTVISERQRLFADKTNPLEAYSPAINAVTQHGLVEFGRRLPKELRSIVTDEKNGVKVSFFIAWALFARANIHGLNDSNGRAWRRAMAKEGESVIDVVTREGEGAWLELCRRISVMCNFTAGASVKKFAESYRVWRSLGGVPDKPAT